MRIRVHFNRKAKNGLVWSLVTSKACYHAEEVIFRNIAYSEYKPNKKSNPKAFITTDGNIYMVGKCAIIQ